MPPFEPPPNSSSPGEVDSFGAQPTAGPAESDLARAQLSPRRESTVGIIFNPISGSGVGGELAAAAAIEIGKRGYQVRLMQSQAEYSPEKVKEFLGSVDFLVIAGGDGTVMGLLPHVSEARTPVYMIPSGNESLFARQFRMSSEPQEIVARIQRNAPGKHHFGSVETGSDKRPFFLMASLGLDSQIVATIARDRNSAIGHIGYVLPTLETLRKFDPPNVHLLVDGREVLSGEKGYLIIANSSQYALKIKLVPEADTRSDKLYARFFPGQGVGAYLPWLQGLFSNTAIFAPKTLAFQGQRFEVSVEGQAPYDIQADGDYAGKTPAVVVAEPRSIMVLD